MRTFRGNDLDRLAILQRGTQWHQLAVYLPGDTGIPDVGVYGIGEVDHGSAMRKFHDVTHRGEHVRRVWKQIDLYVLEKLQ